MKGTIFPQVSVPEDSIPLDLLAKPQERQFYRTSDAAEIQRSTVQFMSGEMKPKGSDATDLFKPFVESVDSIFKGNPISWFSSVHVPEESPRAGNQVETHGDIKSPAPVMPGPLSTLTNGSIGKIPQSFHEPSVTPEPVMVKAAGVVADRPVDSGVAALPVNPGSDSQPQGPLKSTLPEVLVTPEPVMVKVGGVEADRPVEPGVAVSVNPESDSQPQGPFKSSLPEVLVTPEPVMVKAAGVVADRPVESGVAVSVNPESDPQPQGTLKPTLPEALVTPEPAMVKVGGVVADRPVESGVAVSVNPESDPQPQGTLKPTLPEVLITPEPVMAKVGKVVVDRPVESGVAVSVNPESDPQPQGTLKSSLPEVFVTPEPAMAKVGGVVADRPVESGVAVSVDPGSDSQPQGPFKSSLPEVLVSPEPILAKNQLSTPNDQDFIREFTNGQIQADQGTVKIKGQAHIGNLSTPENSPVKPLDDSVGELPQPLPSMISRHSTVQQAKDILALDQTENAGRSEPVETLGRRLSIEEPIPVKPEIQANPEPIQKSTNSSSQEQADQPARSQSFVGRVQPVPSSESGLMTREMLSQSEVVRTSDKQTIQTQSGRIEVMAFQSIETSPLSAETTEGSAGPWVPARGERENGGSETNRQPNPKLENTLSHESSQKVRKDTALLMSPEALSGPSTPPAKTSGETTELPEPAIQSQTGVRNPTLSTRSSNEVGGEAEGLPEKVSSETLSKSISMPESSQKESASGPKVSTELDRVVPRAAQADPGDSQPPISSIKEVAEVIPLRVVREPQMDRSPRREMESQMTSQRSGSGLVISSTTDTAEGIASPQGSTLRTSTTVDVEANILNQVVHAAQLKKTSVGSEIRVRLVPENLGEVHLKVNMTPEGLVAELTASRMATREVLTKHVQQIQGMLVETGLRVDQVVVKTGGMDSAPDFKGSGSSRDPFPQGQDWTNGSQSRDRGARDPWRGYQNPFEEKQPGGWERYA